MLVLWRQRTQMGVSISWRWIFLESENYVPQIIHFIADLPIHNLLPPWKSIKTMKISQINITNMKIPQINVTKYPGIRLCRLLGQDWQPDIFDWGGSQQHKGARKYSPQEVETKLRSQTQFNIVMQCIHLILNFWVLELNSFPLWQHNKG